MGLHRTFWSLVELEVLCIHPYTRNGRGMLARLAALISQLSAVKGVHDRVKILAGYADLKDILKMVTDILTKMWTLKMTILKNRKSENTIIVIRHYSEGEKLLDIIVISPIIISNGQNRGGIMDETTWYYVDTHYALLRL